jgi:hypothetical protein
LQKLCCKLPCIINCSVIHYIKTLKMLKSAIGRCNSFIFEGYLLSAGLWSVVYSMTSFNQFTPPPCYFYMNSCSFKISTRKENVFQNNTGVNLIHYINYPLIPASHHTHNRPRLPTLVPQISYILATMMWRPTIPDRLTGHYTSQACTQ